MSGGVEAALAARQRAESEFLAAISHDIRTPIHGVLGLAELLANAQLPPAEHGWARMIGECARSLLALMDNVLDIPHLEAGRLRVEEADVDLRGLLQEIAADCAARAAGKGLAFTARTGDAVPAWIVGDALRLRQILQDLLDNALKFTGAGACALEVDVRPVPAPPRLAFAVRDTGIGIAPAEHARLFTPLQRPGEGAAPRHPGAGLGLALSRELAQRMGGDIELASRPGEGSTFTLVLPLRPVADQGTRAPARPSPGGAAILLVEDNPVNQVVACGLLAHLGHTRVTVAGDGLQALQACTQARFDLVLMDCQMPGMDGLRATALLRERGVATPIVALTASPAVGDRDRCLAAGMDDYLTKPVEPALLARKVAYWLATPRGAAPVLPPVVPPPADAAPAPAFDARALQDRFFDDAGLFTECRRIFLRQTPARLDEIAACLAHGDVQRAGFVAHSLRGSAGTIGAQRLAECCRALERSVEEGALAAADAQVAAAREALERFVAASAVHEAGSLS